MRGDIVNPELNDAGQKRAALEEKLGEVEVLGKNDGVVLSGLPHDFGIRGVGWPQVAPVMGGVPVPPERLRPREGQAVVHDDGHVGWSSTSLSRVSQVA